VPPSRTIGAVSLRDDPETDHHDTGDRFDELDPEAPSPDDLRRFSSSIVHCPECGKASYDQAELCHHCGHAFESQPAHTPTWAIVLTGVILASFVLLLIL